MDTPEVDILKDDSEGKGRYPTPDESAGVKFLGPHAAEVAGLYADVEPTKSRAGPTKARAFFCKRKRDDGTLCGARFEMFAYAALYCPPCRRLMQTEWKVRHDQGKPAKQRRIDGS